MWALNAIAAAAVINLVNLGWIRVNSISYVSSYRVIFPGTFPEFVDNLEVFVCPPIALIVLGQIGKTEIPGAIRQRIRHNVPGNASFGKMIESRHSPRKIKRKILDYRTGEGQPKMLSHMRECGDKH